MELGLAGNGLPGHDKFYIVSMNIGRKYFVMADEVAGTVRCDIRDSCRRLLRSSSRSRGDETLIKSVIRAREWWIGEQMESPHVVSYKNGM